ncbi:MAG: hypothetical protein Q8P67_18130 [archaeon]|nr:hypothetical protein [archaeon]
MTQPSSKPSPTEATTTTTTTTTTIPSAQPTSTTTETTKETITVPSVEPTPVPVEVSAPASEKEVPSPAAPVEVSAPAPQICDGCHKAVPVIKGVAAPVMTLDDHPGMVFCNQQCLPKDERSRKLSAAAEHAPRSKSPGFRERRRLKKEKKAREKAASKK